MDRAKRSSQAKPGPVAGPRLSALSVITLGFVALFLLVIGTLVVADVLYIDLSWLGEVFRSRPTMAAMRLSLVTSGVTLGLVALFAVPMGYALSRYRFPGHAWVDTMVDLPIVLPPVVLGVSLLVFFSMPVGQWITSLGLEFAHAPAGIVLCQFLVSASFGIRAVKVAFDGVDPNLERLALTLGCTPMRAFRTIALPMARRGIVAGMILAWARAIGVFGPLMVFVGTVQMKTEVMPTTIYLEVSIGRIEPALAVALVMLALAAVAMATVHWLGPGRKWWRE